MPHIVSGELGAAHEHYRIRIINCFRSDGRRSWSQGLSEVAEVVSMIRASEKIETGTEMNFAKKSARRKPNLGHFLSCSNNTSSST